MANLYFCHMRNHLATGHPSTTPIRPASARPKGPATTATPPGMVTLLLNRIREGDLTGVHHLVGQHRWLLEANLGSSPILLALRHRHRGIANVLAFMGMKLNILEAAALGNEKRVQEWLGFHPAAVHARDEYGWTALHHAVAGGHRNIVRSLLDAGADAGSFVSGTATRAADLAVDAKIAAMLKGAASKVRAVAA